MHALSFNADISTWNVSSVEYAPLAFYAASNFRADLSNWNVSNMKDVTKIVSVMPLTIHILSFRNFTDRTFSFLCFTISLRRPRIKIIVIVGGGKYYLKMQ